MRKAIIVIVVLAVLGAAGWFSYQRFQAQARTRPRPTGKSSTSVAATSRHQSAPPATYCLSVTPISRSNRRGRSAL